MQITIKSVGDSHGIVFGDLTWELPPEAAAVFTSQPSDEQEAIRRLIEKTLLRVAVGLTATVKDITLDSLQKLQRGGITFLNETAG